MSENLHWHCLQCGAIEPVMPVGYGQDYDLGDSEKCIACGDGMAHVMTLQMGAHFESGIAQGLSPDAAWARTQEEEYK